MELNNNTRLKKNILRPKSMPNRKEREESPVGQASRLFARVVVGSDDASVSRVRK